MIDYGAILRVDGKLINHICGMFMESSDTGYVCKIAIDSDGDVRNIDGNYFVYAGDEHFLIVFYKSHVLVISDGKIIKEIWAPSFASETFYFNNLPSVNVVRLRHSTRFEKYTAGTWDEFVQETGRDDKRSYMAFLRYCKRISEYNRLKIKTCPLRWLMSWEYDGRKYEVIYGYGVDSNKNVWDDIKFEFYDFSDEERQLIDGWFNK